MQTNVNFYFEKAEKWQTQIKALRNIILDCHLSETLKWGCPCYTFNKRNIVLIHVFKDYCALLFFKGALIKDPDKILIQQTENVQSARQIRFTSLSEIGRMKAKLKKYIFEAVKIEQSGEKVILKKTKEYTVVPELQQKFDEDIQFKKAFDALTPGRQRAYLLHFSSAKSSETRLNRIEKNMVKIYNGKGLQEN